jgi:phage terminase small subunit
MSKAKGKGTLTKKVKASEKPYNPPKMDRFEKMDLSDKQARFCEEYIKDYNSSAAARRAGYSDKHAHVHSHKFLKIEAIQKRVAALKAEIAERNKVTVDMIIQEYKKIAFSNIQDFIDEGNEITDLKKLHPEKGQVVDMVKKSVTEFEGGTKTTVQVKLHSKIAALDALAKHLGFYEQDNKQKQTKIKVGFGE